MTRYIWTGLRGTLAVWVRVAITIALLLLPTALHAQAEKRIALLIGNQGYGSEIGRLANPHNDVALLERTLKALGFEVRTVRDAGLAGLHQAVNAYARRVQAAGPNAVSFFYYSGHGAADAGTNYLIPIDVRTTETGELWDQSLRLTEITRKLKTEAGNATHFVVFDACRNTLKLTNAGSRALVQSKGFVPVAQESGMLIAYATAEGELASDVGAEAGPYAKALAEEIIKPGVEAVAMFRVVQRRVRIAIKQKRYLGFNAMGDVYLAGAASAQATARLSEAAEAWDRAKDGTSVAVLEAFIAHYKDTFYADLASARIVDLKKQQVTSPGSKREQPTTIGGMLQCESYSDRGACEFNTNCSWADHRKQCEKKSGGLATAMLEALPPSKPTSQVSCQGIEALVGKEKRCLKPKDSFKDCPHCPEMVVVPAGDFVRRSGQIGKDAPHTVTIAKPFATGRYEVTFAEWDACFAGRGCKRKPDAYWGRDRQPVVGISKEEVVSEFLPWLSKISSKTYRLLTEAEWEFAALAGTRSAVSKDQAEYDAKGTVEVGSFKPNAFGLYDMHGNAEEMVEDCFHSDYDGAPTDGSAWTWNCEGRMGVTRGGHWRNPVIASGTRSFNPIHAPDSRTGFRVGRSIVLTTCVRKHDPAAVQTFYDYTAFANAMWRLVTHRPELEETAPPVPSSCSTAA